MAVVKPFRGVTYAEELCEKEGVDSLVAPPYDVISEKRRKALAGNPLNIVNVTLGHTENGYKEAASLFRSWLNRGILRRDENPFIYIYEQEFRVNASHPLQKRTGFVGLVRLEEFEKKIIMPHEKTMPKYSQDRLELLRACEANLEQIFGIYNDASSTIDHLLEENKKTEALLCQFTDFQDVTHRLWRIQDRTVESEIRHIMNPRTIVIADGHHRYETSLLYRREVREQLGDPLEPVPADYVMMTLVNIKNPGLLALPTHRLVHGLSEETIRSFFSACEDYFSVNRFKNEEDMETFLGKSSGRTIGVYNKFTEEWGAITLKNDAVMDELLGAENVNRFLDTSILHELVLKRVLGLSEEMQADNVDYLKGSKDVFAVARQENHYQLVFVMRPTPLEEVERAVAHSQRMPQKSTYFYPKIWTGLVMRLLEGDTL